MILKLLETESERSASVLKALCFAQVCSLARVQNSGEQLYERRGSISLAVEQINPWTLLRGVGRKAGVYGSISPERSMGRSVCHNQKK